MVARHAGESTLPSRLQGFFHLARNLFDFGVGNKKAIVTFSSLLAQEFIFGGRRFLASVASGVLLADWAGILVVEMN